jgi:hypothetical protein
MAMGVWQGVATPCHTPMGERGSGGGIGTEGERRANFFSLERRLGFLKPRMSNFEK